ncbi:thioredoxin TrxC [Thioalkalivibrio sp. ALJ24]|uniref:thioredoxin TrxC n=1 Tax=Thioalkalivibrio sp. ALJ24 TaxID=545276 RepID=UPI00047599C9|nr:thioredoxin TrxC [Thioalkalivibrio sp. ALJ24]
MTDSLHVVCTHCDAVNRIPSRRLEQAPKCGQCHAPLFAGRPVELTAARADRHLERGDLPVLVDFWAPWCGPCKMMGPEFERAAAELEPQVRLAKINTDAEAALGGRFGIRSIPTLVLFEQGREVARQPGAMRAADIIRWAREVL